MTQSITLTREQMTQALMGGAILGGGGGGPRDMGEAAGSIALAYGELKLVDIEAVDPAALIVTASAVGAPAAVDKYVTPRDYVRAMEILQENTGVAIGGIITNENGGSATINGWIQAAILGVPLIDAPCNGRAHPTGTMGSMGLHKLAGYEACQAYAGGNPALGNRLEGFVKGDISKASALVRQAAVQAGGLVAVARNPVSAAYVKENGALKGISHAIETGRVFYEGLAVSPEAAIEQVVRFLKGEILAQGEVTSFRLETRGGFDVGEVVVEDVATTFWNEYMTAEKDGQRLYTFPDLIMTFDLETGMPLTTAEIKKGKKVALMAARREHLKLGSAMFDLDLMKAIEPIVEKPILPYL